MKTLVEVTMNDRTIKNIEIENYDPVQLAEELNSSNKNMIALGNCVLQRYSIIRIIPVESLNEKDEESKED